MTDITTLRDALQELVDRDCRVFDRTLEIAFESNDRAYRAVRLAREAYQAAEAPAPMTAAATDVLAERRRQVEAEGWTATHDDQHRNGELAVAAVCYAIYIDSEPPRMWPFDPTWWRPAGDRRNLVKAAALLLAEIERLDRAAAQETRQ